MNILNKLTLRRNESDINVFNKLKIEKKQNVINNYYVRKTQKKSSHKQRRYETLKKSSQIKSKNNLIENKKSKRSTTIQNSIRTLKNIIINNKEIKENESNKKDKFNDTELNLLNYKKALKYDQRSYC